MSIAAQSRFPLPPVVPSADDRELARTASLSVAQLLKRRRGLAPELIFPAPRRGQAETVPIPAAAVELIGQMLSQLARGNAVTIIPIHSEMTTQQAADFLGVSRPHLVKLLERTEIPFRKVGAHRRVRVEDLLNYKNRETAARQKALDELAAESQKLGLY